MCLTLPESSIITRLHVLRSETVWLRGNSHLFNGGRSPNWTPLLPEWCEQGDKNANLCTPSLPKRAPIEWSSIIITTILLPVQGFHNMSAHSDMLLCLIIRKILSRACFYNTIHYWLLTNCLIYLNTDKWAWCKKDIYSFPFRKLSFELHCKCTHKKHKALSEYRSKESGSLHLMGIG